MVSVAVGGHPERVLKKNDVAYGSVTQLSTDAMTGAVTKDGTAGSVVLPVGVSTTTWKRMPGVLPGTAGSAHER